jgi:predicted transcriptional regulator
MTKRKRATYLTSKEYELMKILWTAEKPLLLSDIIERTEDIAKNTLNPMISKLIDRKYIKVVGNLKVSKTYSRLYAPAITVDEYAAQQLNELFNDTGKSLNLSNFFSFIVNGKRKKKNTAFIKDLEKFIDDYRNEPDNRN